ncbi:CrcB protein [Bacilli bacterium PM5-3]|nr:CrcB protein [Bacilli bacterium PM5-3]MDH6603121.1 CrcB protein [Bacilli bacterium PM5-9]
MISISIAAMLGILLRYLITMQFKNMITSKIVTITLIINVAACFGMGLYLAHTNTISFAFTFFLGAFSTFSTFNFEVISKFDASKKDSFMYLLLNLSLSLISFLIGLIL